MKKIDIGHMFERLKIVPVATIEDEEHAIPLGKALVEADLPVLEITFRSEAANDAIRVLSKSLPSIFVGAGTVLKIEQVNQAIASGAQFIVTPGFNPKIVDYCLENDIMIIPGLNTPTMVEWALERGLKLVKFFPADISGGVKMLKALFGPYPTMKFIPTGGVDNTNILEYLKLENVLCVGGSWIVKKELISSKKFSDIAKLTREALALIQKSKII
ncbi:MAG: bifunctional 4-hydroxy-2-oxoglutarate aldolase/2-dehydro-3-deoxy-phosphogluconate aldolase [Promethearchaeota archaeon]|nr:MAG: bifunctional 4-hydroxy-2-oxoglutarate aldolase/2-dehydro-3-deoxy-phosphogluconate aldolase [Candidatus Lokiarchaeota archaeon]